MPALPYRSLADSGLALDSLTVGRLAMEKKLPDRNSASASLRENAFF